MPLVLMEKCHLRAAHAALVAVAANAVEFGYASEDDFALIIESGRLIGNLLKTPHDFETIVSYVLKADDSDDSDETESKARNVMHYRAALASRGIKTEI